jgi:TolB-like protein
LSFWTELRRRKVVRATLAYLAAAFVIAQGAQLLVDALDLPASLLKIIVIVAIALLPLVIAAAWAFDWSPEGVHQTDSTAAPLRWRRIAPAALATLILLGAGLAYALRTPKLELDNNLVAVLPFRVSGSNDIAYLSEGMMDLLSAKLTGEGGPRAADPRSTMSAVKASGIDAAEIPESAALDIARALGAGYVLLGSVIGTPAQLTINATLTDVRTGKRVQPIERTGSTDTLAAFIDHFAAELLSLRAGEDRRLAALTSTSLPALRAYLSAQSNYRASRFEDALRDYRRALELDSTFALAAMGHVLSAGWAAIADTTTNRSRRLLKAHGSRLGEMDGLMADALVGLPTDTANVRSVRDQIRAWEVVVTKAPDRSEGWFLYGDAMLHFGGLAGYQDNKSVAMRAFARSLQLDSAHTPALVHLIDDALMNQDRETFMHLDSVRTARGTASLRYQVLMRNRMLNDVAALARSRAGLDTMDVQDLFTVALTPLVYSGGAADALNALDQILDRATLPGDQAVAFQFAHALLLGYGHPRRTAEVVQRRVAIEPAERSVIEASAILDALYANGDTTFARKMVGRADTNRGVSANERMAADCAVQQWHLWRDEPARAPEAAQALRRNAGTGRNGISALMCAHLLDALHATLRDPAKARAKLTALDEFMAVGPRANPQLINVTNIAAARMWERLGDRDAAYRAIKRQAFHPAYFHYRAAMLHEQARLAALVGKNDEAVRLYRWYLQMNDAAEPSMKGHLDNVRRELTRLTAAKN